MRNSCWPGVERLTSSSARPDIDYVGSVLTPAVRFGLQDAPDGHRQWTETARQAEDLGFDFLCVGDHPGGWPAPMVSLAAAAAVTSHLRLGPYVANAGLRDPLELATDVATLDIVSDGRAILGLGAGHTPAEWSMQGRTRPAATERIDRLIAVARSTKSLLAGQTVSFDTPHTTLVDAVLGGRLVRPSVPLLIGGNNRRLLRFAADEADIIGLTGLGRTLEGGHRHEVRWSVAELDNTFALAHGGRGRNRPPEIQALVQWAEVTNDPAPVAQRIANDFEMEVEHVVESPFILLGTVDEIVDRIALNSEKWRIDTYVVRRRSLDDIGKVIAALPG